jgi:hypothetical protein
MTGTRLPPGGNNRALQGLKETLIRSQIASARTLCRRLLTSPLVLAPASEAPSTDGLCDWAGCPRAFCCQYRVPADGVGEDCCPIGRAGCRGSRAPASTLGAPIAALNHSGCCVSRFRNFPALAYRRPAGRRRSGHYPKRVTREPSHCEGQACCASCGRELRSCDPGLSYGCAHGGPVQQVCRAEYEGKLPSTHLCVGASPLDR